MTSARPLAEVVTAATDLGGLGATAPALLLEVQAQLGLLSALAGQLTERGRRPFRPDDAWTDAIGRLAFSLYNLADQTGVDVDVATRALADQVIVAHSSAAVEQPASWPVRDA